VLDLSSFKLNKTEDSAFKNNYQMLTMGQLGRNIDSLRKLEDGYRARTAENFRLSLRFVKMLDTTGWADVEKLPKINSRYLLTTPTSPVAASSPMKPPAAKSTPDTAKSTPDTAKNKPDTARNKPDTSKYTAGTAKDKGQSLKTTADTAKNKTDTAKNKVGPTGKKADTVKNSTDASKNKPDSARNSPDAAKKKDTTGNKDTAKKAVATKPAKAGPPPPPGFYDYLPDSTRNVVLNNTISQLNSAKVNLDQPAFLYANDENNLRVHLIAWHEKLTLSVACLVMFLIGAPLGSIIRKGGIGMPLVFAVVFFVIFFLLNNFGKKFVKEDVLIPFAGMWMATYVLTPVGLFLVYKALHDSQLFNKEFYFRIARSVRKMFRRRRDAPV
jgi:hypothetical protein